MSLTQLGLDAFLREGPAPARAADAALDERYWTPVLPTASSGMPVSADTALTISAVYRCVSILANTTALLPGGVYRRLERGREEVDHPVRQLMWRRPNPYQTPFEFKGMMLGHAVLRGAAFARIVRRPTGDELWPLHPDRVQGPELLDSGRLRYVYTRPDGQQEKLLRGLDLFVLNGLSSDGVRGLAVASLGRESLGLAMATERYGAALFGRGARFSGAVKLPAGKTISNPKARRELADSIRQSGAGPAEWHGVPIFEDGMEWQSISMSNDDAQFLETRRFSLSEVARWFGIPPHMMADTDRSTSWGTGIEQQTIAFVQYGLLPWLTLFEQSLAATFITEPDVYVRFNVEGLLRGDSAARAAFYRTLIECGVFSPNECRELEERNPRPGGDEYRDAQQTVQVKGDPDPRTPLGHSPVEPDEDDAPDDPPADQAGAVTLAAMEPALLEQDERKRALAGLRSSATTLGISEQQVRKLLANALKGTR